MQRKQRGFSKVTRDITGQTFNMLTVIKRAPIQRERKHRDALWIVQCQCGNEVTVAGSSIRNGHTKSCGCFGLANQFIITYGNSMEQHYKWKGGKGLTKNGYVWMSKSLAQKLYPNATLPLKTGSVFEHRVVMSHNLERELYRGETVHHKNGNKSDNRFENLELHISAHGQGSSKKEIIEWAIIMLKRYAPECLK